MKPIGPALPKLNDIGHQPESTPKIGQRYIACSKLFGALGKIGLQDGAAFDRLRLPGRPGANLAAGRPGMEVLQAFFPAGPLHVAGDANLTLQLFPIQAKRRMTV